MTKGRASAEQATTIERLFNHDLLITKKDQVTATQRWPHIVDCLIESDLIDQFNFREKLANSQKRLVQSVGTAAVIFMLGALLGSAGHLWLEGHTTNSQVGVISVLSESCAILGLILALLASRHGPLRRRWLKNRFLTEVLRQWHFRRLLNGRLIQRGTSDPNSYLAERKREFSLFLQTLTGTVGQKMDEFSQSSRDPLGRIPRPVLPEDSSLRHELLDAYRILRLDHQREFAVYKLSPEETTFVGLSLKALVWTTDLFAGMTLVLALGVSVVGIFFPLPWAALAAILLAVIGVAVRTWRDGLALNGEHERFQEILHRLELLTTRWDVAENEAQQFLLAEEIEQTAIEELRSFIRSQEQAQFLF